MKVVSVIFPSSLGFRARPHFQDTGVDPAFVGAAKKLRRTFNPVQAT
jgi:hypothetical protein